MGFEDLDHSGKVIALKKYFEQYNKALHKLQYLQTEDITILKGVQYTGTPRNRNAAPSDPVPAIVHKFQMARKNIFDQQSLVLALESDIAEIFELLNDDVTITIFESVYFDNHSYEQAASMLGVNKITIRRRINSGLDMLLNNSRVVDRLTDYYRKYPDLLNDYQLPKADKEILL